MKAALKIMGIPFVIPPFIPPLLLVTVFISPFSMQKSSLFSLPKSPAAPKPLPNSIPFTAGIPKMFLASIFSTPSNIGLPSPARSPVTAHSIIPPTELQSSLALSISARIFSPAFSFITGKGFLPIFISATLTGLKLSSLTSLILRI